MKLFAKTFFQTSLIISLLNVGLFAAPRGVYIELGAGLGLNDVQETKNVSYVYKRAYIGSASLGYQSDAFRFELQERYKKDNLYSASIGNDLSVKADGKLSSSSQMLNLYYSGYNSSKLISSFGAGAGITSLELDDALKDNAILSLQGMFSVGYEMSERFIVTTKYTYFYTSESESFKANSDNAFTLTLRYIF